MSDEKVKLALRVHDEVNIIRPRVELSDPMAV